MASSMGRSGFLCLHVVRTFSAPDIVKFGFAVLLSGVACVPNVPLNRYGEPGGVVMLASVPPLPFGAIRPRTTASNTLISCAS